MEHTFKAIIHDGDTVSVHKPAFYANRFKEFMSNKVFRKTPQAVKTKKKAPREKESKVGPKSKSINTFLSVNLQNLRKLNSCQPQRTNDYFAFLLISINKLDLCDS